MLQTKPEPLVKEDSGYAERHHGGTKADRLSKRKPRRVFGLGLYYSSRESNYLTNIRKYSAPTN